MAGEQSDNRRTQQPIAHYPLPSENPQIRRSMSRSDLPLQAIPEWPRLTETPAGPPPPVPLPPTSTPPMVHRTIPFSPIRRSNRSSSLGATTRGRSVELQPSIAPPSRLRRLTDEQSASSAIAVAQNHLAIQQNQLAVATQVPPDTPERALLRQQRDY